MIQLNILVNHCNHRYQYAITHNKIYTLQSNILYLALMKVLMFMIFTFKNLKFIWNY